MNSFKNEQKLSTISCLGREVMKIKDHRTGDASSTVNRTVTFLRKRR